MRGNRGVDPRATLRSSRTTVSPGPTVISVNDADTGGLSDENRTLLLDARPLEGLGPLPEGEILDDLAITKHEAIGKSSANPFGRFF